MRSAQTRYKILSAFLVLCFLILAGRLFFIQIINHEHYAAQAKKQHWFSETLPARRGSIFASDNFPLASSQDFFLLYAEPSKVEDAPNYSKKLAPIIFPEYQTAYEKRDYTSLANMELAITNQLSSEYKWIKLASKISRDQKTIITSLNLPGLGFENEPVRYYPEGTMAAHLLGFVGGGDSGKRVGYYGLEGYYNGDLRGKDGVVYEELSASGNPILLSAQKRIDPVTGRDLYTTIDRAVQFLIEERLAAAVMHYGAKSGQVIVVNPNTGEIIAMASFPIFNMYPWEKPIPKEKGEDTPPEPWEYEQVSNPVISVAYEPGSVMKPMTIASGIDSKTINRNTVFTDSGPVTISGYKIDNWDGKHYGQQNIQELLQKSNNIGACWVGMQIGWGKYMPYLRNFGFGATLGVDLEGEERGLLPATDQLNDVRLCNVSFGQGISATPLQMIMSFSSLVNGGNLYRPYLVKKISQEGRVIFEQKPEVIRRVISESTSSEMINLLIGAVSEGESKFYNLPGYTMGGKTGTAQIPLESGGYDPKKTNATFIGFLPSYLNFVMLVKLEQPSSSIYAAETAVPLWMTIAFDLTGYYGIKPDK